MRAVDLPRSDYTFGDAMKLMSGLATFVAGSRQVPAFERAAEWLPVIEAGKNVLFGEQAAFAGAPDWFAALRTLVDIYDVALRYHYLVKNGQFTDLGLGNATHVNDKGLVAGIAAVLERTEADLAQHPGSVGPRAAPVDTDLAVVGVFPEQAANERGFTGTIWA